MSHVRRSAGLSVGYRIGWRLRYIGSSVFGPAQLGDAVDPLERLRRERAAKLAAAQSRTTPTS